MKSLFTILLLALFTIGCDKDSVNTEETTFQDSTIKRSNGNISFNITFKSPIKTGVASETRNWTEADINRTLTGIDRWLTIVTDITNYTEEYEIDIEVVADADLETNGGAFVKFFNELGNNIYMPKSAGFEISGDMFSDAWTDEDEFQATVFHEMGHILGIGSMFKLVNHNGTIISAPYPLTAETTSNTVRNWIEEAPQGSTGNVGWIYNQPIAAQKYEEVFQNSIGFLPLSNDGGHIFTVGFDENLNPIQGDWILPNQTSIPMMRNEVMGHGFIISKITLGILEDFGYVVDYSKAEAYSKDNP